MSKLNLLPGLSYREHEKIGSLLHLISKKSGNIYLTRLLKLLYLIDERSILEIGVPVTPLEYRVAENGPLVIELWTDLKNNNSFSKYIKVNFNHNEDGFCIQPIGEPNPNRFSEYELGLIDDVILKFKGYSTTQLIEYIHEKDASLWKDIVFSNKLSFSSKKISEFVIDFSKHIEDNESLLEFYNIYRAVR